MTERETATMPRIDRGVPLAPFTTLGIGGPAKFFTRVTNVDELREAVSWAEREKEPLFFLGGGSNLLISDAGFEGLVVKLDLRGITVIDFDQRAAHIKVAAGEPWDGVVSFAVDRAWAGIECLSGIPGSTGATPIQNVGAYGQEVSETIIRVEALDRTTGRVLWLTNEECRFGYRSSLFKNHQRDRYVVLSVTLRLKPGDEAAVRYPELGKQLAAEGIPLDDLRGVRAVVLAIRRRKGMVIDPSDPDTRSDGSFFMNPIIPAAELQAFLARAGDGPVPHFPSGDEVKLSAAWLIDHAGFHAGFVHGNVGLSTKHALAVINRGGGTAAEVLELVKLVQDGVREKFGVEINPEPNFVGFVDR
jgi:UDP-N-acetylmuramate dehydrogenase